jgi:hypothetical protein
MKKTNLNDNITVEENPIIPLLSEVENKQGDIDKLENIDDISKLLMVVT